MFWRKFWNFTFWKAPEWLNFTTFYQSALDVAWFQVNPNFLLQQIQNLERHYPYIFLKSVFDQLTMLFQNKLRRFWIQPDDKPQHPLLFNLTPAPSDVSIALTIFLTSIVDIKSFSSKHYTNSNNVSYARNTQAVVLFIFVANLLISELLQF